jgi:hypothetical protein
MKSVHLTKKLITDYNVAADALNASSLWTQYVRAFGHMWYKACKCLTCLISVYDSVQCLPDEPDTTLVVYTACTLRIRIGATGRIFQR